MAYRASWYLNKRIVLLVVEGEITLEDLPLISQASRQYIAEGTPPVHLLIDMTGLMKYPTNLREAATMLKNQDDIQVGWTLIITNNLILRFLCSMLVQFTQQRVHGLSSIDDAMAFLLERDVTLDENELKAKRALS